MTYAQHQGTNADTWEYDVQLVEYTDVPAFKQTMNTMGSDGWELVTAAPVSRGGTFRYVGGLTTHFEMIFKRPRRRAP